MQNTVIAASATALLFLTTACATEQAFEGSPNVFIHASPQQIANHLSYNCLTVGGRIVGQSNYHFVCAKPMDTSMGSMLYRSLLTERYSSNPEVTVQTSWSVRQNGTYVSAAAWTEHQSAFGKTTKNYLDQPSWKRNLQDGLEKMKETLEGQR